MTRYGSATRHYILTLHSPSHIQHSVDQFPLLVDDIAVTSPDGSDLSAKEKFMVRQFLAKGFSPQEDSAETTTLSFLANHIIGYGFREDEFFAPYSIHVTSIDAGAGGKADFNFANNHENHFSSRGRLTDHGVLLEKNILFPYQRMTSNVNPAQQFIRISEQKCFVAEGTIDCLDRQLIQQSARYYFGTRRVHKRQVIDSPKNTTTDFVGTTEGVTPGAGSSSIILYSVLAVVGVIAIVDLIGIVVTGYYCLEALKKCIAVHFPDSGQSLVERDAAGSRGGQRQEPMPARYLPGSASTVTVTPSVSGQLELKINPRSVRYTGVDSVQNTVEETCFSEQTPLPPLQSHPGQIPQDPLSGDQTSDLTSGANDPRSGTSFDPVSNPVYGSH